MDPTIEPLLQPDRIYSRAEVLGRPSPAPAQGGLYAWWFRTPPPGVDTAGCAQRVGLTLLYVGISPQAPPTNGRPPSRASIRQRLRTHFSGNAAGSTLRLTLGCLLGDDLGLRLRRVGSTERLTFTNPGEQILDRWMSEHALVSWKVVDRAWEVERQILASGLPLPLNLAENPCVAHTTFLSEARRRARLAAREASALSDSGGPRRG